MASAALLPARTGHARALVLLIGIAIFINYVDRGNLATAGPLIKTEMGLSNTQFGLLVSAFFWTYAPSQLLAGWLAQRYCSYRVLAAGLALWAVATMMVGLVQGFAALLVLRLVLGLGESVAFPCSSKLITDHVPPERFGQANAASAVGLSIGPAFGTYAGGLLMASWGWRASFILFGALSLLWLIPWLSLKRDAPRIHESVGPGPSILEIARRRPAIVAAIGHFCINYSFYFMLAWLPIYLVKVHGLSMVEMATLGGFFYLVTAASSIVFGYLPDRWIAAGMTTNRARKTMLVGGLLVTAGCMVAAAIGSASVAIGALFVSSIASGATSANLFATGQTLAGPSAAGRWIGFQNSVGNLSGIVAPALTGFLVDRNGNFGAAFGIAAGVALFGVLCWSVLLGRIEMVDWGSDRGSGRSPLPLAGGVGGGHVSKR